MDISALESFAEALKSKFSLPGQASPEDQLKTPVAELLREAGEAFDLVVGSRTETHLPELKVRPDVAIYVRGLICGYIELKAPGLGADAPKLKGKHNKAQWNKLKGLPNLIYTDGREWALYRSGERSGPIIRFNDDPTEHGRRAVTVENAEALGRLLRSFLGWAPIIPHKPRPLAAYLAPLTRFLRTEVEAALTNPDSAAALLAGEWRRHFFPEADDGQFADAYAQTVTYALLLARLSGADDLDPAAAKKILDKNNGVLALALERLGQKEARAELRIGFELLQRSLMELDPHDFLKTDPDIWLYFYEDFLAAYDPKLRRDYGVYYTPREVVELQVRLVSELLESRFGKMAGFADDGVVFLDPAVGTGTYPVAAVKYGLAKVRARYGEGAVPARAAQMARNMYGFEILIGPYAVAHLRLTQALESEGAVLADRLNIYLADTLGSPNLAPPGGLTLTYRTLTREHEAARKLKLDGDILVCLGNPPYDREQVTEPEDRRRKGSWVRYGDQIEGAAQQEEQGEQPILEDFLEPARKSGRGLNLQVIFNDYIYFWRWALWRLFEKQNCGGIVSFITASSYLTGPGFAGVRETMRRTFDDVWILDLGGDNLGARKTPNVFSIQIPVCIAVGISGKNVKWNEPAKVKYARIDAISREEKLKKIDHIRGFESIEWVECSAGWQETFTPVGQGRYFDFPKLTDIFPFHAAGSVYYRNWPISESKDVLESRWNKLTRSDRASRKQLFKESRDRKITYTVSDSSLPGYNEPSIISTGPNDKFPLCIRYGYRSFDRQFALFDFRLGDYMRPAFYRLAGEKQIFLVSPDSIVSGSGPLITVSAYIPDQHFFCGRGGKDVMPLYRDADGDEPNVATGLLDALGTEYRRIVVAEDIAAYIYALLGGQSYTRRFWNELETPGPRVPITRDAELFAEAVALGRRLIWLHTYAERFRNDDRGSTIPAGKARCSAPVSDDPTRYPEDFVWIEAKQTVRVGDGRFDPVPHEVWNFKVSGLKVVQSWLGYRMKKRAGKKSSPLDDIRPERWTPRMTEEFLELLWVLEATLAMEPELERILDRVVSGPCFLASELPQPAPEQQKPPAAANRPPGALLEIMDSADQDWG